MENSVKNKIYFFGLAAVVFLGALALGYYGFESLSSLGRNDVEQASVEKEQVLKSFEPVPVTTKLHPFLEGLLAVRVSQDDVLVPDERFVDLAGKSWTIRDFLNGRPVLLNFWASWCAPCLTELPSMERFAEKYKDRIDVLAISLDLNKTPEVIKMVLETYRIGPFAGFHDPKGAFAAVMGVRGLPVTLLLAPDGRILYVFEGEADWNSTTAHSFFDDFLAGKV